jgi:hypothetical protein
MSNPSLVMSSTKWMLMAQTMQTAFLFTELGTSGSVAENRRLGKLLSRGGAWRCPRLILTATKLSRVVSSPNSSRTCCASTFSTTSHARRAVPQTPACPRARTVSTSLRAIVSSRPVVGSCKRRLDELTRSVQPAEVDEVYRPSRRVSRPRSARERRCAVERLDFGSLIDLFMQSRR